MEKQLNCNTLVILSLKNDIANQAIKIEAKTATIAAMKIDQQRLNAVRNAISKQNEILEKELAEIKLGNKTINEKLEEMNQQNAYLNANVEEYKKEIEVAESRNKPLEIQLLESTQKAKAYGDARARLLKEITTLKKKNEKQIEEIKNAKLIISRYKCDMEEKDQELTNRKEKEEKTLQENESTVAKLLAQHAIGVSLLQLQLEQERDQKENETSNLSNEIAFKETEVTKLQERECDLEANLKSSQERFYKSYASTQNMVGNFMNDIERKYSSRCFYKPRIKCSTVRSRLQLITDKTEDEFSILH